MGRRRDGSYTPEKKISQTIYTHLSKCKNDKIKGERKNISIQDLVGNEENVYPVPDPNKTMINVTNEPSDTHKNPSKGNHGRNH
jgi:hypothetical protein